MSNKNLLHSIEFISALRFEAGYASNVRGGHLPAYLDGEKKGRLIAPVNYLTAQELKDLTKLFYTSKN